MLKRMASSIGSRLSHHKANKDLPGIPIPEVDQNVPSLPQDASLYTKRGSISVSMITDTNTDFTKATLPSYVSDFSSGTEMTSMSRRQTGRYKLDDFIIQRTLGTGSFGRVHLVRSRHNLRFYAMKVMNKERVVRLKQVEHTNNEQNILLHIQHPFIINLWGIFQDTSNLYMVMDFVPGGELFMLLRRSNRFPDPVAKFYAAEVALGLAYLHSENVIYRDLKPENILLNADGHIKIADFGFAKSTNVHTYTLCGTPDYLAPEIVRQGSYNHSVDWYALGVLVFEMLSGMPPYHQATDQPPQQYQIGLYERISAGIRKVPVPSQINSNACDLIYKLMEIDPTKRFGNLKSGPNDVFAHPWFSEVDWQRLANREITSPYLPRISGDGDASAFESYPEDTGTIATYGLPTDDPFGNAFPEFEYTNPSVMDL